MGTPRYQLVRHDVPPRVAAIVFLSLVASEPPESERGPAGPGSERRVSVHCDLLDCGRAQRRHRRYSEDCEHGGKQCATESAAAVAVGEKRPCRR